MEHRCGHQKQPGQADGEARTLAARYASPTDLAEAGVLLRKQLSTSLTLPGEDATAEDLLITHLL